MRQSNNWKKTVGILARVLRAVVSPDLGGAAQRKLLEVSPTAEDLLAAERLQFICSMEPSIKALTKGKLVSLGAKLEKGLVMMHGRIPKDDLAKLLGKE